MLSTNAKSQLICASVGTRLGVPAATVTFISMLLDGLGQLAGKIFCAVGSAESCWSRKFGSDWSFRVQGLG